MTWDPKKEGKEKREGYRLAYESFQEILHTEGGEFLDEVALMATLVSLLKTCLPHLFWVGFYRLIKPDLLVIGPYQGTPGCLSIPVGRGVCGECALKRKPVLVPDVTQHPDHIACDPRSRSELVLPVLRNNGELLGVLDMDSHLPHAFDDVDIEEGEKLLESFSRAILR